MIEAIVGNRNAGLTPVADQVTDPSLISLDIVGIAPPLRESCPNPSRTKRITCSVRGTEGALLPTGGAGCIEAPDEPTSTTMEMPTTNVATRPNPLVIETPLRPQPPREFGTLAREFSGRQAGLDPSVAGWRKGFAGAMLSLSSVYRLSTEETASASVFRQR